MEQKGYTVNFLDVTLSTDGSHKPYKKPNNSLKYVNKASNHPPCIPRNIPSSIEKRLNTISSSEVEFNVAKADYERALVNAGYSALYENTTPNITGPHVVPPGSVKEGSFGITHRSARMLPPTSGVSSLSSYNYTSPSSTRSTASLTKIQSSYRTRAPQIWCTSTIQHP